jgi:CBS domain-containing protein
MSPRAAWRLEALGYVEVFDYVAGKADWRAAGLATEGDRPHPRRVAQVMRSAPTCRPDEPVAEVMTRIGPSTARLCVVINDHRFVQGRLRLDRVDPADDRPVEEVMDLGPATVRADADLAETTERMRRRNVASMIVSDPDGVLLGVVTVESSKEPSP